LLNTLKLSLRTGEVDEFLKRELAMIEDQVAENCSPISKKF